jgi:hypothetical protein
MLALVALKTPAEVTTKLPLPILIDVPDIDPPEIDGELIEIPAFTELAVTLPLIVAPVAVRKPLASTEKLPDDVTIAPFPNNVNVLAESVPSDNISTPGVDTEAATIDPLITELSNTASPAHVIAQPTVPIPVIIPFDAIVPSKLLLDITVLTSTTFADNRSAVIVPARMLFAVIVFAAISLPVTLPAII